MTTKKERKKKMMMTMMASDRARGCTIVILSYSPMPVAMPSLSVAGVARTLGSGGRGNKNSGISLLLYAERWKATTACSPGH
ncbi:hypothetical protein SAMD00023353_4700420 [Rosellinia necatrix]|uniref:Uncharacterized protein n=1 Tax=Rosellinia necatrix TaxID=77044 RepID=A0A1S8A9Q3_ROSNE|nr:hypothetical protein SAMD00023353_4700420 [Rosellinia necatrix]